MQVELCIKMVNSKRCLGDLSLQPSFTNASDSSWGVQKHTSTPTSLVQTYIRHKTLWHGHFLRQESTPHKKHFKNFMCKHEALLPANSVILLCVKPKENKSCRNEVRDRGPGNIYIRLVMGVRHGTEIAQVLQALQSTVRTCSNASNICLRFKVVCWAPGHLKTLFKFSSSTGCTFSFHRLYSGTEKHVTTFRLNKYFQYNRDQFSCAHVASARFPTCQWSIGHNRIVSQCASFAEVWFWLWICWAVAGMLWVDNRKVKGRHSKICLWSQVLWVFQGGTPGAKEANEPMWSLLQIPSDWLYRSFPGRKGFAYKPPLSTLRSIP